jgi:hypothetical protein
MVLTASGVSPAGLLRSAAETALQTAEMQANSLIARMLETEQDFQELRELVSTAKDFEDFHKASTALRPAPKTKNRPDRS